MSSVHALFPQKQLIPVVVIDDISHAVPLAEALLEGGIRSIEITLRTEAGLAATQAIAAKVPNMILGTGTVLSAQQMQQSKDAGAQFQVSPGYTASLAAAAQEKAVAWLPGVANASQVMQAREDGFDCLKLFPASLVGGAPLLKQLGAVFSDVRFCPTGGVSMANLGEYAALKHVFAIGGSWLAPKDTMASGDWAAITQIAKQSVEALG